MSFSRTLVFVAVGLFAAVALVKAWGNSNKVKLQDIQSLTLYYGKMTTGRRSKPVPQIQCVGGTGGCNVFVPQVVQCYNRGSDGYDVQWECKTDMDNSYRFGRIDVICEGYDYPDDPYVLKGSCGLEYTIDLTEEGIKKKAGHNYYSSGDYGFNYREVPKSKKSMFGDIIMIAIILLLIYGIYRTCLSQRQFSPGGDDYDRPDSRFGTGFGYPSGQPPPPGFRSDYGYDGGCGTSTGYGRPTGAGNFWSGAMTGGILGYMFGNRNRGYQTYDPPMAHRSSGGFNTSSSFTPPSSGTRTASGFGGTRRR